MRSAFWPSEQFEASLPTSAEFTSEYRPGTVEYSQTNEEIDLALIGILWETQEISQLGGEDEPSTGIITMELGGVASFYLDRRQHWRSAEDGRQLDEAGRHRAGT
jgi:hypothetical protein